MKQHRVKLHVTIFLSEKHLEMIIILCDYTVYYFVLCKHQKILNAKYELDDATYHLLNNIYISICALQRFKNCFIVIPTQLCKRVLFLLCELHTFFIQTNQSIFMACVVQLSLKLFLKMCCSLSGSVLPCLQVVIQDIIRQMSPLN